MSESHFGQGLDTGNVNLDSGSIENTRNPASRPTTGTGAGSAPPRLGHDDVESVVGDDIRPGSSNVSGGVVRRRKRGIGGLSKVRLGGAVSKNYRTSTAVMFNNFEELIQDAISREFAQEIMEDVFDKWGVPLNVPESAKYAEDLLFTFLIAVTASNKADYDKQYDIPVKGSDFVEADFLLFSKALESVYGTTRRQFARAVADDLRFFLKQPDNQFMLPQMATRVGCEPQMAYLAFDGSTHCTGMTSREIAFTKTLESRNLFERDDILASGASDRLMQGVSGGVRSVAPR